ncbi:MAG: DNA gyrase subunit B [Parcubacteria group bacterium Athens1014_10]|nr:MAG: DNA gyrase subunit B [Parcubacteria group bacterium Athens1014_10]TSD05512.1 MAG: DNA gyrase subunit B [Parcubacteria group bacterium Athens0714_12]
MANKIKNSNSGEDESTLKEKMSKTSDDYKAKHITVLEGLAPVRKRPAMYIGNTGSQGLHHLIWECLDNAVDEALAGFCNEVVIELLPKNIVRVSDNGRGIPVDIHKPTGKSALEVVLTKLHAGGKFENQAYKVSGGLHGVGVSVVNALSIYLRAEVKRDGDIYAQEYRQGDPLKKVKAIGKTKERGTTIIFQPDPEIFPKIEYNWDLVINHLRQQAYLTKGVKFTIIDNRQESNYIYQFYFEGGISSYVRHLNRTNSAKHEDIFYLERELNGVKVEIALQYTNEYKETVFSFANNINTHEGGSHLVGFRTALTRALNSYARQKSYLKEKDENLSGDDIREGLTAVISVKASDPQFEGQTKTKLGNPEVRQIVDTLFNEYFSNFLEENPKTGEAIIGKAILASRARQAARAARETVLRKGVLDGLTLPGKLSDCSSKSPEESELFIVEGDSAGGCFGEDTEVALTDGRNLSFKQLVQEYGEGKKNYCYTIRNDGTIGIGLIENPRRTKIDTEVIKVALDNNKEIICTLDHKFMLRDGTYKMAKDLTVKDSLMPLRKKYSKKEGRITIEGYEMIFDPEKRKWIFTHLLADDYNLKNGIYSEINDSDKHHIDFNKLNNNPENIKRMPKEDHWEYHRQMIKFGLHREDVKEKSRKTRQSQEYREKIRRFMTTPKMRRMLSERAKKQWENKEYKQYMIQKSLEFYKKNPQYQEKNNELLFESQKRYWSNSNNRIKQAERVKEYFCKHPEKKKELSEEAKRQWQNEELLRWRRQKTKEQWTSKFRAKRRETYNQTYQEKSFKLMKEIFEKYGELNKEKYQKERLQKNDKSLLRYETICQRFFNGNEKELKEAVFNYNHKIKKLEIINKKIDVYDLEVENTHNFALASGVFVHNSCKQGRDRRNQAILPLRGKILNVEKARLDKMLANNEIKALIVALGTNIGEQFDISGLRYQRIVIMTDADVDGAHIRTLLLTLFYRYFPDIIKNGYLYIARPPLYKIQINKKSKYAYSDEEKDEILKETKDQPNIQRYKGLGEMNPDQLWETTMNPETRTMRQVGIEDAEKADEIFEILMGSEVGPRKKFIQTHAKSVKNLDI